LPQDQGGTEGTEGVQVGGAACDSENVNATCHQDEEAAAVNVAPENAAVCSKEENGSWTEVWSTEYTLPNLLSGTIDSGPVGKAFKDGDRIALVFYGNLRLVYGYTQQSTTTYPNLGVWNGEHVLGQYDGSGLSSIIETNTNFPGMTVSHTNLP